GKKVFEITNANAFNTISVSELPSGTYIVKVINNSNVITKKINIVR
ncbi:MAG TPA: T9SS type A sorting domain-containing protein, partial [Bacteroidales bacterium]|nr:T9SS type A sorting domain-containing protein [Bacteroidales bacterium]